MKLYTEEQLQDAIWTLVHSFADGKDILEKSINSFTPIELPTDEEIEEAAEEYADCYISSTVFSFDDGAKWMRDKIKGGNK